MANERATLTIRPVLYSAPVFYEPRWWTDTAKSLAWVKEELPVDEKPTIEMQVSLEDCLGDALETACEALEINVGSDGERHGNVRTSQLGRIGFVELDRDVQGVPHDVLYSWPRCLPAAKESGEIIDVPWREITFRELLVSSQLGLILGDVTRPYIYTGLPQGSAGDIADATRISVELIRNAYIGIESTMGAVDRTYHLLKHATAKPIDAVNALVDEGTRMYGGFLIGRWLHRKRLKKHGRDWLVRCLGSRHRDDLSE